LHGDASQVNAFARAEPDSNGYTADTGMHQTVAAAARHAARPWVGPVARVGLATKGIVYLIIGGLALTAATGSGGRVADNKRAVHVIAAQPHGDLLLLAVAIGFGAYAVWRALSAAIDLEGRRGARGIAIRIGYALSAAVYGGLALMAAQLAAGEHPDHPEPRTWVARVLAEPYGNALVMVAGLGFCVYALFHVWRALRGRFEDDLDLSHTTPGRRALALWLGRIGTAARGVVFAIIGYHLVLAGRESQPGETRDVAGALSTLAARPHGHALLGVIAAGLFLYGAFVVIQARVARIPGARS
jgi:hypothetical protein